MNGDMPKFGVSQDADSVLMRNALAELLSMQAQVRSMREDVRSLLKESRNLREKVQSTISQSQVRSAERCASVCKESRGNEEARRVDGVEGRVVCATCGKLNVDVGATICVACGKNLSKMAEL